MAEKIIEDCFVQGYRILCNNNQKVVIEFLEKIERNLKENTTETMVTKLEKDKEKTNKKLTNLLDVFECLIDKVVIGETLENGAINPYTIRFICKNGTEINCKDKFTAVSDKQAINNIATSDKQHMWSV